MALGHPALTLTVSPGAGRGDNSHSRNAGVGWGGAASGHEGHRSINSYALSNTEDAVAWDNSAS